MKRREFIALAGGALGMVACGSDSDSHTHPVGPAYILEGTPGGNVIHWPAPFAGSQTLKQQLPAEVDLHGSIPWPVEIHLAHFWTHRSANSSWTLATGQMRTHEKKLLVGWNPWHPNSPLPALQHELDHLTAFLGGDPNWATVGHRIIDDGSIICATCGLGT